MKVRIVLKGESNLPALKALLPDEIQAVAEFIPVGERSNLSSVARTALVKHQEPVAVLVETHSLHAATIQEKLVTTEELLRAGSNGAPCRVILCVPVIEAILFTAPEILQRIFPKVQYSAYSMFFGKLPKEALAFLFTHGGGPTTLSKFLDSLTEEDVERLRATGPIRELITFVSEVVDPVGKHAAT